MKFAIAGLILACTSTASAQKFDVKIVDRQDSATGYTYFAPGRFNSQSNANLNCYGDTSVNCYGSSTTNGTITAPHRISYEVRGATFTLLLPDGRAAVVNCESKYMPKFDYINRRSCRMPLVDDIRAEFHGDKAKLEWVVSLDGKKMQSETYKVLAILGSPQPDQPKQQVANVPLPSPAATVSNPKPSATPVSAPKARAAVYKSAPAATPAPAPAAKALSTPASAAKGVPTPDLFVWFDESAPTAGTPLLDVILTVRAYDGAVAILRKQRHGSVTVRTGANVLDPDYHPTTATLLSWHKRNPNSAPWVFYWLGEEVNGDVSVVHFQMTKRAYEELLALSASSDLRIRP
jgi:hypothetical protein